VHHVQPPQEKKSTTVQPSTEVTGKIKPLDGRGHMGPIIADPRSFRIQKILQSGVMDLQQEKFNVFSLAPTSPYDLYQSLLRTASAPTIRQIGAPGDDDSRDMEVNTDDIIMVDKSMQFSFADDTLLCNLMEEIKHRKQQGKGGKSKQTLLDAVKRKSNSLSFADGGSSSSGFLASEINKIGSAKLSSFLKRSLALTEGVLAAQQRNGGETVKDDAKYDGGGFKSNAIIDPSFTWLAFGGGNLISSRPLSAAKFSTMQPTTFITAHPYPEDETLNKKDLRPFKVRPLLYSHISESIFSRDVL
jgi:hypothetical protein